MYPIKTPRPYNPRDLATTAHIFTTPYLGNYVAGDYDEGSGSHPGVDIVPMAPMSSVYAILDARVIEASENPASGKFIILAHANTPDPLSGKSTTLYSSYLHLSEISVTKGQILTEGDIIGKTGSTGQSTGEHLHFQIDRSESPFHPYWPFSFKEAKDLGLGFMEAVNRWLGIENAEQYTVNPLVYLDSIQKGFTSEIVSTRPSTLSVVTPKPPEIYIASTTSTPDPATFSDVPPSYPYAQAVQYLKSEGIAHGQNGRYFPNAHISRGELLKIAFNASALSLETDKKSYFSDVPTSHPFIEYVNTARARRVVGGYADGTFRPNAPVTRAEGLKIILGLFQTSLIQPSKAPASDVLLTDWVAPMALWATTHEALGLTGKKILPNSLLTRGEVANIVFIARTL